jgi:hypothetical protein
VRGAVTGRTAAEPLKTSSYSAKYRAVTVCQSCACAVRRPLAILDARRPGQREEVADGLRECRGLGLGEPGVIRRGILPDPAGRRRHQRCACRHGFERCNPERLARIRMQHDVRVGVARAQRPRIGDVAEQMDADRRAPERLLAQP